jgi:purine-binding chemotaxis protein CheW
MEYAAFLVGEDMFAIPVALVQEIGKPVEIFPVPGHDARVAGLVNLRGRTAVALDLRRALLGANALGRCRERCKFIVLETTSTLPKEARDLGIDSHCETLVLVVDEVHGIVDGQRLEFHPPPAHVCERYVEGVMKMGERLMTLVSIPRLIEDLMPRKEEQP